MRFASVSTSAVICCRGPLESEASKTIIQTFLSLLWTASNLHNRLSS